MKCIICNEEMEKQHTWYAHKLKYKDYFDTYLKQSTDGICQICGKPTLWHKQKKYYHR